MKPSMRRHTFASVEKALAESMAATGEKKKAKKDFGVFAISVLPCSLSRVVRKKGSDARWPRENAHGDIGQPVHARQCDKVRSNGLVWKAQVKQ